ncbi:cytochrome P450 [Nocardia nepalensis]|uniref:cytochrome P450 n=1 Tax=Nocardia nepalensis TaxID=3375448 RepID=UPI003B672210
MTETPSDADAYLRLLDPAVRPDPYPLFAQLRAGGPFRISTAPIIVLSRHADCAAMLRDPRASVDRALATRPMGSMPIHGRDADDGAAQGKPSFLFLDPPDHTRLRRLVSTAFTPRMVARLEPRITELVDAALDRVADTGGLDAVEDFAYPLPVAVICELLGVPLEDEPLLRRWSALLARTLDPAPRATAEFNADPGELERAGNELYDYFEQLTAQRRARPGDDLLSRLIAAEDSGDMLDHDELITTCALLLIAGHETTVNLIANGVLALLRNPNVLSTLRAVPGLASAVVEETLRYDPPAQLVPRIAAADLRIGGIDIGAGDFVVMLLAAANRDPDVFADPDRFDPYRDNRHLAFGLGGHFCLGAPLARLEGRIALEHFARRVRSPLLRVDPPPYRDHVNLRGPAALPIEFSGIAPRH